jgi:hypothetical protein
VFQSASGLDISFEACKYAREHFGVEARFGNFLNEPPPEHPYDICCLWDTIEHIKRPDLYIEKISNEISDNGLIALTTGDIGSLNARIRGKKWRQIHPPTHLHYFSYSTIEKLLEKYNFSIINKIYPGNLMSLDTICYIILVIKSNHPSWYSFLKKSRLLNLVIYINLFDIMFVIARKR